MKDTTDGGFVRDRDAWLQGVKNLVLDLAERDALLGECCPQFTATPDKDRREHLRKVAQKSKAISKTVAALLESERGRFGVTSLLKPEHINDETALVVYAAVASRLDASLARMFRRVSDYTTMIAARDAAKALRVRCLWMSSSPVYGLFAICSNSAVLDDRVCVLRERFMCKASGVPVDPVGTEECEDHADAGRWR